MGMERSTQDWAWRRKNEELHLDCIDYEKRATDRGMIFWGASRWGRIGLSIFFDLEDRKKINSTVYWDQILLGLLKEF